MHEQIPEPTMWKCPLCEAGNEFKAETYKICDSCGWGKKIPLPEKSHAATGTKDQKRHLLWETGKTLALAICIAIGVFALLLKFLFSACGL